ncbi:hypothetical protein [Arthrobacter sp. StoSoilB5]|uniref:hypothetical protein n=1 Tax=Arthrobacter sp. StoSoilB5 TaxID=2830992 RepID=UPI0031FE8BEF
MASAPEYLALPNVACVGGSWLTPKTAVEAQDWARFIELARGLRACRTLRSLP